MDWLKFFITFQWQRKLVALLVATAIWVFVNQSISDVKTISNVPVRVINLPEDKIISGMQPNGIITKRIALTLTGSQDVIRELEPGDLEVLLDASDIQQNDWVVQISKKNLVSLNPLIDVTRYISDIKHPEFVLKFSKLMTTKIPVKVKIPKGFSPVGYEYLDVWPQELKHTVVGPQEQVQELLNNGLELEIDLSMISKADLDKIKTTRENFHDDEVSFFIPTHWKKISIPFKNGMLEEINDPEAQNLHIDFLRKEYIPLNRDVTIRAFYPLDQLQKINPSTAPFLTEGKIKKDHGITYLSIPLYVKDVSPLFLEVVKNNLEIVILAEKNEEGTALNWSLEVIDPSNLEDLYVKALVSYSSGGPIKNNEPRHTKKREAHLRNRFREYIQKLMFYTSPDKKLHIDARLTPEGISVIPSSL